MTIENPRRSVNHEEGLYLFEGEIVCDICKEGKPISFESRLDLSDSSTTKEFSEVFKKDLSDCIYRMGWKDYGKMHFCPICQEAKRDGGIDDVVNHPNHYISKTGLEAIDVIKSFTTYKEYATGNILKYIMRWRSKNGIEDLKKAQWYLNDLIKELEKDV